MALNTFVYEEISRVGASAPDIQVEAQPYFGQCAEDLIVVSLIQGLCEREGIDPSGDRYLEIGANHPIATSATYLLNCSLRMRGVLVEPNPRLLPELQRVRPEDVILPYAVTTGGKKEVDLYISNLSELTSLSQEFVEEWAGGEVGLREVVRVEGRGINDILAAHFRDKAPIYLSLDVEGMDLNILMELDFARWRPAVIQIEPSDFFIPGNTDAIQKFLTENDYVLLAKTNVNLIFGDLRRLALNFPDIRELNRRYTDQYSAQLRTALVNEVAEQFSELRESLERNHAVLLDEVHRQVAAIKGDMVLLRYRLKMNVKAAFHHPLSASRRRAYRAKLRTRITEVPMPVPASSSQRAGLAIRLIAFLHHPMSSSKRRTFRDIFLSRSSRREIVGSLAEIILRRSEVAVLKTLSHVPFFSNRRRSRFSHSADKRAQRILRDFGCGPISSNTNSHGHFLDLRSGSVRITSVGKICVILHAYYVDTAEECLKYLRNISAPFDLFITTPAHQVDKLRELAQIILPDVRSSVIASQNRGRNFGPLLAELSSTIVAYDLLLHLHTKKSLRTGSEQDGWRTHLLKHLVGSKDLTARILAAFADHDKLGIVAPVTYSDQPYWCHHWLSSGRLADSFFTRLGIPIYPRRGFLDYPVGGMFWARTAALLPLWLARWSYQDFPAEPVANDGTLAHVIERGVGIIPRTLGYDYGEVDLESGVLRIGIGDKGLSRYFMSLPLRLKYLENFQTISFDFFDTLFTRLAVSPEDVQSAIGHLLASEGVIPDGSDFLALRKQAEAAARKIKGKGDVNLKEIYAAWPVVEGWSKEAVTHAEALEYDVEVRVMKPRQSVIDLARGLAERGKRILIISDTYFDRSFIQDVLTAHHAADIFAEILVSSATGLRKDTGAIWSELKSTEADYSKLFIHVGDNEHSDSQLPSDAGLKTMGVVNTAVLADLRKCPMPAMWREARDDWRSGVLLGPLVARVGGDAFSPSLSQPFTFNDARDLGYCILGPIAFQFMSWLTRRASVDGIDRFYFLARGAYFLHRLYSEIRRIYQALPPSQYLMVSRRAVLPAAYSVNHDAAQIVAGAGGFKGTFGELMNARLGIASDAFGDDSKVSVRLRPYDSDRDRVLQLMREHATVINEHCSVAYRHLRAYMKQEGLLDADRPGLVDLGYAATIQRAIQTVVSRPLAGYYFGTTSAAAEVKAGGGCVAACFGQETADAPPPAITRYSILLEAFFAGPTGQVDGYTADESGIAPIFQPEPESGAGFKKLEEAADGMQAYCLDILRAYGPSILSVEFDPDVAIEPLRQLVAGWGGIPTDLRPILLVDDAFCGNPTLDAVNVLESVIGAKI